MELTKPSFFKILINDFSTRLQIPPAFINTFGGVIPNRTELEAFGKTLQVKVEKIGKGLYFINEWSDFVKANNLELGDFLIFKYLPDHSKFKVTVYGKTCCVKQFVNKPVNGKEDHQRNVEGGRKRNQQVDGDEGFKEAKRIKTEFDSSEAIYIDSDSSSGDDETAHTSKIRE